jgi:transcriptional regulator with XRE-family HTH domain
MVSQGDLPESAGFAERLTYQRERRGLTQSELARRTRDLLPEGNSFNRASISRYEKGDNVPRRPGLLALAEVLEVSAEDLLPRDRSALAVQHVKPAFEGRAIIYMDQDTGATRLTVNDLLLPFDVAMAIMKLITDAQKATAPARPDPVEKKDS